MHAVQALAVPQHKHRLSAASKCTVLTSAPLLVKGCAHLTVTQGMCPKACQRRCSSLGSAHGLSAPHDHACQSKKWAAHAAVHGAGWDEVANNSFYTSPEGLGNKSAPGMTGAMDVWGLGCSVFEMLTQRPLFAQAGDFSLQGAEQSCKAGKSQRKQVSLLLSRATLPLHFLKHVLMALSRPPLGTLCPAALHHCMLVHNGQIVHWHMQAVVCHHQSSHELSMLIAFIRS